MRKTVLLSTNLDVECLNYVIQAQHAADSLKNMADQIISIEDLRPSIPVEQQCPAGCGDSKYLWVHDGDMKPCPECQGTRLHPLPMSEL